jgi:nicotinate-nucleotide adenylyltransferase
VKQGPIGVFGGTYNPVHFGHLRSALELRERLNLAEVRLMPAAQPPHREPPSCTAELRAEMVALAVDSEPGLVCDTRELLRDGPSYSIDSLLELRAELGPERGICLILGADALQGLPHWHRWQELIEQAHIVAMARPGWQMPTEGIVADWIQRHARADRSVVHREPCGAVLVEALRPLDISSTDIRQLVAAGHSPRYLLPDGVWSKIKSAGLYGFDAKQ